MSNRGFPFGPPIPFQFHFNWMPNPEFLVPPTFDADDQELEVLDRSERLVPPTFDIALNHAEHRTMALQRVDDFQRSYEVALVNAPVIIQQAFYSTMSNVRSAVEGKLCVSEVQDEIDTLDADPVKKVRIMSLLDRANDCFCRIGLNSAHMIQRITRDFKGECASIAPAGLLALPDFRDALVDRPNLPIEWQQESVVSSSPSPLSSSAPQLFRSGPPSSIFPGSFQSSFVGGHNPGELSKRGRIESKSDMNDLRRIEEFSLSYAASLPADHPEKIEAEEFAAKAKEKRSWATAFYQVLRTCGSATKNSFLVLWDFVRFK